MFARFFIFLIFLTPIYAAKSVPSIEEQIKRYTMSHQKEQLSLLAQLVNINSGTANVAGVHRTGEILRPAFEKLGFKTYWTGDPADMHRAGTLIAERLGHEGKKLLLIGHLDTVFPVKSGFKHFERQGNMAKGPGVIDDKGGDVVILYALKALQAAKALDNTNITVVLTGDEEDSGKPTRISRKPFIEVAKRSDIALDFECAVTLDTATIARRGFSDWVIQTQGIETHSSEIFQKQAGDGAIFELARILNSMRTELGYETYLTFSPGLILGGTLMNYDQNESKGSASGKSNVIAKTALARGDLRYMTSEQKEKAKARINNIINQHLPGTTAAATFQDGIPGMPPTPANLALLKLYSEVSLRLGYGVVKPLDPGLKGAGDISYAAPFVGSALAGLGPAGSGAHSVKETLDIDSLPIQTQRAALFIYELTHMR